MSALLGAQSNRWCPVVNNQPVRLCEPPAEKSEYIYSNKRVLLNKEVCSWFRYGMYRNDAGVVAMGGWLAGWLADTKQYLRPETMHLPPQCARPHAVRRRKLGGAQRLNVSMNCAVHIVPHYSRYSEFV